MRRAVRSRWSELNPANKKPTVRSSVGHQQPQRAYGSLLSVRPGQKGAGRGVERDGCRFAATPHVLPSLATILNQVILTSSPGLGTLFWLAAVLGSVKYAQRVKSSSRYAARFMHLSCTASRVRTIATPPLSSRPPGVLLMGVWILLA